MVSEPFLEDGIPHVRMEKVIADGRFHEEVAAKASGRESDCLEQ